SIDDVLRENLTDAQLNAARDRAANVLCLACAGSGKSRTLAFRIAHLLADGASPSSIVAFTFTEKAAESIKLRVATALEAAGLSPLLLGAMYIGTIHGYCQSILGEIDARYRQYEVLDDNRLKLYLISRYATLRLRELKNAKNARYFQVIREVANAWSTFNDELLDVQQVRQHDALLADVLELIRDHVDADEFIDFSMMIRIVVDALRNNHPGARRVVEAVDHLMVDEYQDVNPLQEELIRLLRPNLRSLLVVGDDDQAIYAWRGANVRNILEFHQRYPGTSPHTLSENFRSTDAIVEVSDAFAAAELGPSRFAKNPTAHENAAPREIRVLWFPERPAEAAWVANMIQSLLGTRYLDDPSNELSSRGLTYADFAILMRSTRGQEQNGDPRHAAFTRELTQRNIPYSLESGGSIFDRPHVAVLRASFELLRNGAPTRIEARTFFDNEVLPLFPHAAFETFARVLTQWGRRIHPATGGPRVRLYPQQLVHDLLGVFGLSRTQLDDGTMQAIGTFSRIMQDVESVYMSVDSAWRYQEVLNFLSRVAETGYDETTNEILRRPNTVTVSTVHKMKGLEFPVVFVVDVEAQRFPNRRSQYQGWLPPQCLGDAIGRGAYQCTREEEVRLFYTAITRAERFLYVSGCAQLPNGRRATRRSDFAARLRHQEIVTEPHAPLPAMVPAVQRRRIDETVMPTSYSDIRYYLKCPHDYKLRKYFGFSPPISDLFGFGNTVHAAVCKLHEVAHDHVPTREEARAIAEQVFHVKHVPKSKEQSVRKRIHGAFARLIEVLSLKDPMSG
ncbi:MAG: ATP-dependent helicase, partial [Planctomycetes bacterium]|nr:ATP-dependent helicase [Planctomycetota bacterium]